MKRRERKKACAHTQTHARTHTHKHTHTHIPSSPQEPTLEGALAGLPPDAADAAAAALRREGVTAAQLRSGAVTDADLEEAGLAADARAAIAAWQASFAA